MDTFIVWADGHKSEAKRLEAVDMPAAIEQAADEFGITADQVNIITLGEAEFYGVAPCPLD